MKWYKVYLLFLLFSGRTLDFVVDLSNTSIIGRKFLNQELHGGRSMDSGSTPSNQSSLSRKGSGNEHDTCWKKPQNSQVSQNQLNLN